MANIFESLGIDYLKLVVRDSSALAEIIRKFDYSVSGSAYKVLKNTLVRNNINYSHIKLGASSNKDRKFPSKRSVEEFLSHIKSKTVSSRTIKNRLLSEGILLPFCSICNIKAEWCNLPLTLHLDHINGNHNDNTLSNLRLLCPNCHSQTPTYCGKHLARKHRCETCGQQISCKNSKNCSNCFKLKPKSRKFEVSKEELQNYVWLEPTVEVAKRFGVSDSAISKRCKRLGISKPPRGYWQKINKIQY